MGYIIASNFIYFRAKEKEKDKIEEEKKCDESNGQACGDQVQFLRIDMELSGKIEQTD